MGSIHHTHILYICSAYSHLPFQPSRNVKGTNRDYGEIDIHKKLLILKDIIYYFYNYYGEWIYTRLFFGLPSVQIGI